MKFVKGLIDQILHCGRHHKISCLYACHDPCRGNETKTILKESMYIVTFPSKVPEQTTRRVLETYCGLNKTNRDFVRSQYSRPVYCYKNAPLTVIGDQFIKVLVDD